MTDDPFRRLFFYSFSRFDYYKTKTRSRENFGFFVCVIFRSVLPYGKTERFYGYNINYVLTFLIFA